ncbi:uncharacterized protein LACBIDRAFT_330630 [Laccaria bicolor S238N-H82]|uniref:Predicted protein n=1 Tax=Laccaria bicolor (strain S238N-H82 / ATCC MYA-4686) TaxID=486041 RepID=B0DLY6_LACBS|nr:uncharacterized protein LACBIDRAFT_330630 [Laccaria bicolor S238N-H82]EDR04375.1 predicted protein [Laccaria bicolor S238N-H82]|eukprot:XP_001884894.1 predicted protein [Laccaria bicolor S238N-H82]
MPPKRKRSEPRPAELSDDEDPDTQPTTTIITPVLQFTQRVNRHVDFPTSYPNISDDSTTLPNLSSTMDDAFAELAAIDPAYFDALSDDLISVGPRKKRPSDYPLKEWIKDSDVFLEEDIRWEGRGEYMMENCCIHEVGLDFCNCEHAQDHFIQLLRFRWFPASVKSPKTAVTFHLLKHFQILSFESKVSAFEFYTALARETENTGISPLKGSYSMPIRLPYEGPIPWMRDSHLVLGLPSIYVPKSLFPGTPQEEGLPWFWDSQHLFDHDPTLIHNFEKSIFTASTFNLGPNTITLDHTDSANVAHGLCAITALGDYDYTLGGHMIIFDLKLIIEFPPGSTILIPSAVFWHGNTPIQPGETRMSFTQFVAGGLFRWVKYGFRTKDQLILAEGKARLSEINGNYTERCERALSLFSKLTELNEDRRRVFAK